MSKAYPSIIERDAEQPLPPVSERGLRASHDVTKPSGSQQELRTCGNDNDTRMVTKDRKVRYAHDDQLMLKYKRLKHKIKDILTQNDNLVTHLEKAKRKILFLKKEKELLLDCVSKYEKIPKGESEYVESSDSESSNISLSSESQEFSSDESVPTKHKRRKHRVHYREPKVKTRTRRDDNSSKHEPPQQRLVIEQHEPSITRAPSLLPTTATLPNNACHAAYTAPDGKDQGYVLIERSSSSLPHGKPFGPELGTVHPEMFTSIGKSPHPDLYFAPTSRVFDQARHPASRIHKVRPHPVNRDGSPILPMTIGTLTIKHLGKIVYDRQGFHSDRYLWPVGFESRRSYMSMVNPNKDTIYICKILDGGDHPWFQITPCDAPENVISHRSASGAWTVVIRTAHRLRGTKNMRGISGPDLFGFSHPRVVQLLQDLPGIDQCKKYRRWEFSTAPVAKKSVKGADSSISIIQTDEDVAERHHSSSVTTQSTSSTHHLLQDNDFLHHQSSAVRAPNVLIFQLYDAAYGQSPRPYVAGANTALLKSDWGTMGTASTIADVTRLDPHRIQVVKMPTAIPLQIHCSSPVITATNASIIPSANALATERNSFSGFSAVPISMIQSRSTVAVDNINSAHTAGRDEPDVTVGSQIVL